MSYVRISFPRPCEEKWEEMAPAGCHRLCARCDKVIHDLSQLDFDEADALLRNSGDSCVRAQINGDGEIALRPARGGGARKMVIAIAATATLFAVAEPALGRQGRPQGAIVGTVEAFGLTVQVTATGQDGSSFRARVDRDGRYRIRRVPAGTYTLTFDPSCGENWTLENIVVGDGPTTVRRAGSPDACIVIGQASVIERGELTINRTTESTSIPHSRTR